MGSKSQPRGSEVWTIRSIIQLTRLAWSVNRVGTLRALYWLAIGKRLRGRCALAGIAGQSRFAYQTWIEIAETRATSRFFAASAKSAHSDFDAIVTNAMAAPTATQRTVDSIRRALSKEARIHLLPGNQIDRRLLGDGNPDQRNRWLLALSPGDEISVHLKGIVERASGHAPDASVLYWNTDEIVSGERRIPFIKPAAWDPILHAQADCLASSSTIRMEKAFVLCSGADNTQRSIALADLQRRIASELAPREFAHVPLVLTHHGRGLGGQYVQQTVCWDMLGFPEPSRWPSIAIIIPTRDRLCLLRECLNSLAKTEYPGRVDVIVVDNDSKEAETKAYLKTMVEQGAITVVEAPGPFNFSRLNNLAVDATNCEFLCLLNNDVTIIDEHWLTTLARVGVGENVGAVGPMLLYPDGTIQHAGVAIGVGNAAGHIQRGIRPDTTISPTWTRMTRQVSAVTGACLLVRRSDYLAVGGLDEQAFAVAFNDVDFCLKLQTLGRQNIYVASAVLYHHESKSRGSDLAVANLNRFEGELERLQRKWRTQSYEDPWFSPMFSRASEQCVLSL